MTSLCIRRKYTCPGKRRNRLFCHSSSSLLASPLFEVPRADLFTVGASFVDLSARLGKSSLTSHMKVEEAW
jgi:hypothetical protein